MRTKDEIKAEVRALIREMNELKINEAMERFISDAEAWIEAYRDCGLVLRSSEEPGSEDRLFRTLCQTRSEVINELRMLHVSPY